MQRRLKVADLNVHVTCMLCHGYLVDATAIIECLHAFCRTCIVRHLEESNFCPVCEVQVHKTTPLRSIRSDQTLQNVVYKVVPGLYQNEMRRRREFYAENPEAVSTSLPGSEDRGEGEPRFFSPKDSISLSLQHRPRETKSAEQPNYAKNITTRHLSCPAAFTVGHLKKFVHLKFSLPNTYTVDMFYDGKLLTESKKLLKDSEKLLKDSYTLMDIAYMYSWERAEPMKFCYNISKRVPRSVVLPPSAAAAATPAALEVENTNDGPTPANDVEAETTAEPEPMEVDSKPSKMDEEEVEVRQAVSTSAEDEAPCSSAEETTPSDQQAAAVSESSAPEPPSSADDVQPMDVTEQQQLPEETIPVVKSPSLPEDIVLTPPPPPLLPEPTYNSVKVVSTPERNLLSPTNGFRLKFIHDPELNPKSQKSKKSGRKSGRSSRHKNVPVRLQRLAPYPSPPVACLSAAPQPPLLPQLAVGKLVPSVITTLAPTFVTTLVSTTSNTTPCKVANGGTPPVVSSSSFPSRPVSSQCAAAESSVPVSSTSATPVPDSRSSPTVDNTTTTTITKELPPNTATVIALPPPPPSIQESRDSSGFTVGASTVTSNLTNSVVTSSEVAVTSTSSDVTSTFNSRPPVPAPHSDSDSLSGFREELEPLRAASLSANSDEKVAAIVNGEDTKSESFRRSVKNSISAEFSDNDDLGCQPDLVVDEQKMDSDEEEEDTALRKKIDAIAGKEDEADVTDDTEGDSGRASDMSCPARCEDAESPPVTAPPPTVPAVSEEGGHRPKQNSIDHVIKQLYLQHEIGRSAASPKPPSKDETGALDLSTCTRRPDEACGARPRPVANPVLDTKHRQQTYMPAPVKQHTACPPAPKHPTTSPLLMHQLTGPSILQAQLTGPKVPHLPTYVPRTVPPSSSPAPLVGRPNPPSYSYRFPQNQSMGMFPGMIPYSSIMNMVRSGMMPGMSGGYATPGRSASKETKTSHFPCHPKGVSGGSPTTSNSARRLSDALVHPNNHCRSAPLPSPTHPRTSPSLTRMSPLHRSASPAPSPQAVASRATASQCNKSIHHKKSSTKDFFKSSNKFKTSTLAVFKPDPNEHSKLVIKKLDARSNNHH